MPTTKPTITTALCLPTLDVSLAILPQTDVSGIGGSITSYTLEKVTGVTTTTQSGLTFKDADGLDGFHYLRRVFTAPARGTVYSSIRVRAVGPGGNGTWSDAVTLTCTPETSRPMTVQQRLADLINDAAITYDGRSAWVCLDGFARPRLISKRSFAGTNPPWVEVGIPRVTGDTPESGETYVMELSVPVRIATAAHRLEEAAAELYAVAEQIHNALIYSEQDLSLNYFGIRQGSVSFSGFSPVTWADQDNKAAMIGFDVNITARHTSGGALY